MSTPLTTPTFDARDYYGSDNNTELSTIRRPAPGSARGYDRRDRSPLVIVWMAWSASCTICFLAGAVSTWWVLR